MQVTAYDHNTNTTLIVDTNVTYKAILNDRLGCLQEFAQNNSLESATQAVASHPAIQKLSGKTELPKLVEKALWGKGGLITQAQNSLNGTTSASSKPKSATVELNQVYNGNQPVRGVFTCKYNNRSYCVRGKVFHADLGRDLGDAQEGTFKYDLRLVKHIIQVGLNLPRYERVYCTDWVI
jgi:hypothetical protein